MANNKVDFPSKAVRAMRDRWVLVDALMAGQNEMRRGGPKWIPQGALEHPIDYCFQKI